MADGYILPEFQFVQEVSQLSTVQPTSPWGGWGASVEMFGAKTDRQPFTAKPRETRWGYLADGFGMLDWYNRIHYSALTINLGNIVSQQTRDLVVWNAYLVPRVLSSITASNNAGITLTAPATPYTFNALAEHTFTFSISLDGPATVDAVYNYIFDVGTTQINLVGQRVIPWLWKPDWSQPIVERLEWLTNVMEAKDATEQRVKLREFPRRTWEFSFMTEGRMRRRLDSILYGWGARSFALPLWVDGAPLTQTATVGGVEFRCETLWRDYAVGGMAIALDDSGNYEVAEIESIQPTYLTLTRPLGSAWPVGTMIYPVRKARLPSTHGIERFTGDVVYGTVRMDSDGETCDWPLATETTYRGIPVMTDRPNWIEDISHDMARKLSVLDYGVGKRSVNDDSGQPAMIQSQRWLLASKADLSEFRSWLYSRAGKHKAIWVPTWSYDMIVVGNIGASGTQVDIESIGYRQQVNAGMQRRDIRIALKSGAVYYRRITAVATLTNDVERLSIDTALGVDVTPADIDMVSYMQVCRLDSDGVEISYFRGDVGESSHNMRAIRYDV